MGRAKSWALGARPLLPATKQTSAERLVRPFLVRLFGSVSFGGGARCLQPTGHPYLSQGAMGWPFRGISAGNVEVWDLAPGPSLCHVRVRCPGLCCLSPSSEAQGFFVWVTAPGPESSKGCGPGAVRGRDPAVGQVDEDSCGQPSLFVWVGEGELAFAPARTLAPGLPQRQGLCSGDARTPKGAGF